MKVTMRHNLVLIIGMGLLLFIPMSLMSQSLSKGELEQKWLNRPSAPLQFTAAPLGNVYAIGNRSDARVIRYQLGCVLAEGDAIRILNRRPDESVDLAPMDRTNKEVHSKMIFSSKGAWQQPFCESTAKLAVLEVEFSDGGTWRIMK
jgi:hypothetical protein